MSAASNLINLHHFFEHQANVNPHNIALICQGSLLTYQEIEQRANQWANFLAAEGVKPGQRVALLLERSVELYIAMLAILKAGAAYVPIDPEYPLERISYILSDSGANALISVSRFSKKLPDKICKIFDVNAIEEQVSQQSMVRPHNGIAANDLSYIIYTSGTTGRPKGVAITHASVCHYVKSMHEIYRVTTKDRVYQGFSISFDASIEEIWLAFANGATLVVGASNAIHAGAALAEFLNLHRITVLSTVPTMLMILDEEIPSLRLLILGGEVCTNDLVMRWSRPGLRILNTYGPTEATIIATYAECKPNKPVTIGHPIPDFEIVILDENFQPTTDHQPGELCIGGAGLAQGYINQPELMQKKFIPHPTKAGTQLYRTGDLAAFTTDGEIQFLGRLDEQVKLRGYRIELSEIEAVVMKFPGVRNSVVALQELSPGVQSLVGFLVPKENVALDVEQITAYLHTLLPEYMVPGLFEIIAHLPLLPSGKVDRKNLPKPKLHHDKVKQDYVAPRNNIEQELTVAWEEFFKHSPISIKADFFHDLGGHSLAAAKIVSHLRKNFGMEHLSMLDLYESPTIEKLAEKIAATAAQNAARYSQTANHSNNDSNADERFSWRYLFCGIAQAAGCYIQFALSAWQFLLVFFAFIFVIDKYSVFSLQTLAAVSALLLFLPPALFVIGVAAKWLLLGRMKPGTYRLWGWFYVRWWLVQRIQRILPIPYLVGSPLMNLYYRSMGAKIGKNCYIASVDINAFDLLTVGDDSSIGYGSVLTGYTIENGWLRLGTVTLGKRCFVGTKAVLNINTALEDDAKLEDLSMLPENITVPSRLCYAGSPAQPQKINLDNLPTIKTSTNSLNGMKFGIIHYFALLLVTLLNYAAYLPTVLLINYFYENDNLLGAFLVGAPLGALTFMMIYCFSVAAIKKILLRKMLPGSYKVHSKFYVRRWIMERLVDNEVLGAMSDSLFFPFFLRLLGGKIGKRVETGHLLHVQPDLLIMEDESFCASSIVIGAPRVYGGYATFNPSTLRKRAFVGNFALIPGGTELGSGSLIGCLSIPPNRGEAKKPTTSWLGSPPVFLPKRETFAGFSEQDTFNPPKSLYFARLLIEFIRILLPTVFMLFSLIMVFIVVDYLLDHFSLLDTVLLYPAFEFGIFIGLAALCIALKWLLVGRVKESVKPLWSLFIWKNDIVEYINTGFLWPSILEPLLGTPFLAFFLRSMGMKIGKRVLIDTFVFAEVDLIDIGNDVVLNKNCVIQTHLFEDRIFKLGPIKINDGCNVGAGSIVLYNTIMEKNSSLGSLSLLMKGETLPANSHWEGIPAQHVSQYSLRFNDVATETVSAAAY